MVLHPFGPRTFFERHHVIGVLLPLLSGFPHLLDHGARCGVSANVAADDLVYRLFLLPHDFRDRAAVESGAVKLGAVPRRSWKCSSRSQPALHLGALHGG
jgi:hypothetical protein